MAALNPVLIAKAVQIDAQGNAMIPDGIETIGYGAFDSNKLIRTVALPASVKELSTRAFADCRNLETVQLNEGLEVIGHNVFSGCTNLKYLVMPDSLKEVEANAFYETHFSEPIYNRSGTGFHHYPNGRTENEFTIPQGVKRLFAGSFFNNTALKEVVLPEGLETIDRRAFLDTKIRQITIPSSVKKIENSAFWKCPELETVNLLCDEAAVEPGAFFQCPKVQIRIQGMEISFEHELRIKGISLLGILTSLTAPKEKIWEDERFKRYAIRCAGGDVRAMLDFADFFEKREEDPFYQYAANFWRFRAYKCGDPDADAWVQAWLKENPRQFIPSVLGARLSGTMDGDKLRSLGFLIFDPDREYSLGGIDFNGIVEVSSWCGDEGPDADGYGREEYYDWWYLDKNLTPIPGVQKLHSYSFHERRTLSDRFDAQYAKAVEALQDR